jgi:predicted TIM-barrel fold metal-dependent hydrolase
VIDGIDVHVHVHTGERARKEKLGGAEHSLQGYFRMSHGWPNGDEVAEKYRALNMMAVIFDVDHETKTGEKISNDDVADAVRRHPDVLIGFGSVDPWKGPAAVDEVKRCVEELGLRGMKFEPASQGFAPNDTQFYPIWEACARLKVPALFHTGMAGVGAGTPGGGGVRLRHCQPLLLDDVAVDFPELTIIGAHPSWPWQEEMLAIARHKANVFIDLSGWAPKYFPASLVQHANSLLQDKVLFGSDYPLIATERWLKEFGELNIKDEVRPKILRENARRVLGIELPA